MTHPKTSGMESAPTGVFHHHHPTHKLSRPASPAVVRTMDRNQKQDLHFTGEDAMPGLVSETWSSSIHYNYAHSSAVLPSNDMSSMTLPTSTATSPATAEGSWTTMNQNFRSNESASGVGGTASPADAVGSIDSSFLDAIQPTFTHKPAATSHILDSMLASSSSSTDNTLISSTSTLPHYGLQAGYIHSQTVQPSPQQTREQSSVNFMSQGRFADDEQKQENEVMNLQYGLPTSTASGTLYHQSQPPSYNARSVHGLHLTDLGDIHQQHQQQLIQSWTGGSTGTGGSTNPAPSPATPAFFTPSFLDSLQHDERGPDGLFSHSTSNNSDFGVSTWQQGPTDFDDYNQQTNTSFSPLESMVQASDRQLMFSESSPQSPHMSPPVTPVYGRLSNLSLRPHTIHETEEDYGSTFMDIDRHQFKAGINTARMMQNAANVARIRPLIQNYLQLPDPVAAGEKTVIILTSKVAQKSYGNEKRFLCPPPTAILVGTTWWVPKAKNEELGPPSLTVCISGETTTQAAQLEWYTVSGKMVGQTGHPKPHSPKADSDLINSNTNNNMSTTMITTLNTNADSNRFRSNDGHMGSTPGVDWYHNHQQEPLGGAKCVSKQLFINDADEKRKRVEYLLRIQLANGASLGTLASRGIKVISKPSRKRQSIKNMELCIHHGTTVSLFNRIRSQTVSTKYLGVSSGSSFVVPGYNSGERDNIGDNTCFVARTTSWDPFVIWLVDTTRSPKDVKEGERPEDYIGHTPLMNPNITYPPPPAIALKNTLDHPVPLHYNQHIVLQCVTTGLVSPVMIIRKIDKASTAVGGARATSDEMGGGGEFGDEVLGDPVSQLHKIALQIVQDPSKAVTHHQAMANAMDGSAASSSSPALSLPRSSGPVTYLACLNDMVGMHKVSEPRQPIVPNPALHHYNALFDEDDGKATRKRHVSLEGYSQGMGKMPSKLVSSQSMTDLKHLTTHRRVSSHTDPETRRGSHPYHESLQTVIRARSHSVSGQPELSPQLQRRRRSSIGTHSSASGSALGTYWSEDVSDASVWTIVGTDSAILTFWAPDGDLQPSSTPFPFISTYVIGGRSEDDQVILTLHGENFSRDMQVWFGDVKSPRTEYRGRENFVCHVPPRSELLSSAHTETCFDDSHKVLILLVRGDGIIFKTRHHYCF